MSIAETHAAGEITPEIATVDTLDLLYLRAVEVGEVTEADLIMHKLNKAAADSIEFELPAAIIDERLSMFRATAARCLQSLL